MKQISQMDKNIIKSRLIERYSNAVTELSYSSLYELIIAVMLSAQCTDERVNKITPALFNKYPDIKTLSKASLDDIKDLIKSCSFFNNKARNLLGMAKMVLKEFNGEIPLDPSLLIKLPGVGQKTANVVMIEFTQANLMAVDTHVFRVSHRLGLSRAKTPNDTEKDLINAFKTDLHILHQGMVLFGRYICTARNPKCKESCFLQEFCQTTKNFKPT